MSGPTPRTAVRIALCSIAVLAPRRMRPRILNLVPDYHVDRTSSIGASFLCPSTTLIIGPHVRVGHLTVARRLERLELGAYSQMGNFNLISGVPRGPHDPYIAAAPDREPELVLGERAVVTNRHYFDCADSIRLAEGSVIAGLRTIFITHGLNLATGELRCHPVRIGRCSMVSTACMVLMGSVLPDYCVLTPMSLLRKAHTEKYRLYGGNPAVVVRELDRDAGFFRNAAIGLPED
jgi:hypothetical protein